MTERKKKLIEVGLPLEAINAESAREKSIRHGHPSTLHLWWARRPLATARAVLFAQLVDDPSARPEEFPAVEAQDAERRRLHRLIEAMVVWENTAPGPGQLVKVWPMPSGRDGRIISGRAQLWQAATDEIRRSNGGELPAVLDPFAGGGTIPLEAQRLGLEAHASDLNPVAVLINKALVEIPPKFADRPPVHPGADRDRAGGWPRATGLAEDVRHYGQWMRDEAFKRIGHLYPKVAGPDGQERTVIAWIWARTVKSPNPANPIEVPLVRSWWLGKKKGKEAWVKASVVDGQVRYEVMHDAAGPVGSADGTIRGGNGTSIADGTPIPNRHIRAEAAAGRLGAHLIAVVAEGNRQRLYLDPPASQLGAASVARPVDVPDQLVPTPNHDVDRLPMYGMPTWADAFTNRQLVAMTTFSDLVAEARERVLVDAMAAGTPEGARIEDGGTNAAAYADAVATYLALALSKMADYSNSLCRWMSQPKNELVGSLFARQAVPMTWDYAETNPFGESSGSWDFAVRPVVRALAALPGSAPAEVVQHDASAGSYAGLVVSTDPPYYDNIGYSDLSDFFYVWLRRSLGGVMPELFSTMLVPKAEELVANPYRHGDKAGAERFFVDGFNSVFRRIRRQPNEAVPMTVYYAYKQQEAGAGGTASAGWYTLLDGLIGAGWEITATWPVRSERGGRMLSVGTNALASSIVLACRPRPGDAPATTRRALWAALKGELPAALRNMMQGAVAPVDLAQAAIGPGMAIFSRYSRVREADGSEMSVRDALALINATLDEVMDEQESDFDPETRFAVKWYRTYGWGAESSGTADTLSRATGTSPAALERGGIFEAKGGKARLVSPTALEGNWDPEADTHVSVWEATVRLAAAMAKDGAEKVAALMPAVGSRVSLDMVKELGFLLFHEAEKKGDTGDAIRFNGLVSSWGDLMSQARRMAAEASRPKAQQGAFELDREA